MDPTTWKNIETVLDAVLDMAQSERTEYLNTHVQDETIRAEVLRLLQAEENLPNILESDIHHYLQKEADVASITASIGNPVITIDRFEMLEEIGRGGMSVVYRARRTDGEFDHDVAVKIIQPFGMNREEQVNRLRAERQILAGLKHPNIAQVYDGGVTPEGWPYMIMELVVGVSLTRYCRENDLGLDERLQLFQTICDTVIYAHRSLVLHRDLKPGNILITNDGNVKLLDFGIAKLLAEGSTAVPLTRTGNPLLTPEYAAPEQFLGKVTTTAIDVYSLGVILYELLAGTRPFDLSGKSIREMEELITDRQPLRPSEAACLPVLPPAELSGDLDVICLKALRKEPENRYQSVQELKEDIQRYLAGIPITARQATRLYRIRKFAGRHKAGVTAVAIILIVITGFFVALIHQQRITEAQRNRAQTQAIKAEEIIEFMLSLFQASDPAETRGDTLRVTDFLGRGLQRADQLHAQPDVQADMLELIARAYRMVSLYEDAHATQQRVLEIRRQTFGDMNAGVANAMVDLGTIKTRINQRLEADSIYNRALAIQQQLWPSGLSNDIANTLQRLSDNLIHLRRDSSDVRLAADYIEQAMGIRGRLSEAPRPDLAEDMKTRSRVAHYQNDRDMEERLLSQALDLERMLLGDDHPETIATFGSLGVLYYNSGRYREAEEMHRLALNARVRVFGDDHPQVARSYSSLAMAVMAQRDFQQAAELFEAAQGIYQRAFGEHNHRVAAVLNNSSQVYMSLGDFETAIRMQEQALEITLMNYDEWSQEAGSSYYLLSMSNRSIRNYDAAIGWARKSLEISRRIGHDLYTGWDLMLLARLYDDKGDYTTAESLMIESMAYEQTALPDGHHHTASSKGRYGRFLMNRGRADEAEPLLREALDIRTRHFGSEDLQTVQIKTLLAECLVLLEIMDEAETLLKKTHEISVENGYNNHIKTVLETFISMYRQWDKPVLENEYRAQLSELN